MYTERTKQILEYKALGWNNAKIAREMHCDPSAIRFILDRIKRLEEYSQMSELYKIIIDAEEEPLAYILKLRRAHIVTVNDFLNISDENFRTIFIHDKTCGQKFLERTKQLQQVISERT